MSTVPTPTGRTGPARAAADIDALASRVRLLRPPDQRRRIILGIAGEPGAGKTTLATKLARALAAPVVPLDGFHLANAVLARLGRLDRKGAIDTFDLAGYHALICRISAEPGEIVYAPAFERRIDQAVAGAIAIQPGDDIVITEGNYLLSDHPHIHAVRRLFAEAWYVGTPDEIRISRLVRRHEAFGKSRDDAVSWATGTDQTNADLVRGTSQDADLLIHPLA